MRPSLDESTQTQSQSDDLPEGRSLYNDFTMHQRICKNRSATQSRVHVPRCHYYVDASDRKWWSRNLSRLPEDYRFPRDALITDRVPPFPQVVQEILVDLYCPKSLRSQIKASEANQDCIIRPYLGRRRRLEKQSKFQGFSLRNFPLHADQIEELALDGPLYARVMAETLADLYWRVHVDANDMEFVLAPRREDGAGQPEGHPSDETVINSQTLGEHVVWILDFDCCREMSMDENGVKQAVRAFYRNDPYYPRPGCELWTIFKERFLEISQAILDQGSQAALPFSWIDSVERTVSRRDKSDDSNIVQDLGDTG